MKKYAADAGTINTNHVDHARGSRHTTTVPLPGPGHVIILGAKQTPMAIEDLKNWETDPVFDAFCSRVSNAVQALSPVDMIAISKSHQVRSLISLTSCFIDVYLFLT